ncbi:MAG: DUF4124 domain-containing protein [Rhodocyclaceae bacterium]|nr:DUF4124 domain-containing protein [Rhodocyclaceae bacterium]
MKTPSLRAPSCPRPRPACALALFRGLLGLALCVGVPAAHAVGSADASTASAGNLPGTAPSRPAPPTPLYRYTDAQGRTVYTNRPPPAGVHARALPYVPSPPQRPQPPAAPRPPPGADASLTVPRALDVPGPGQQRVLIEQLAKQVEALHAARNALKEGEAVRNGDERNYQRYLDRVQVLRDAVTRQEGVVEALQGQVRLLGAGALLE